MSFRVAPAEMNFFKSLRGSALRTRSQYNYSRKRRITGARESLDIRQYVVSSWNPFILPAWNSRVPINPSSDCNPQFRGDNCESRQRILLYDGRLEHFCICAFACSIFLCIVACIAILIAFQLPSQEDNSQTVTARANLSFKSVLQRWRTI